MQEYKVGDLSKMLGALYLALRDLATANASSNKISTEEFQKNFSLLLDGLKIVCVNFEADTSLIAQITDLESRNGDMCRVGRGFPGQRPRLLSWALAGRQKLALRSQVVRHKYPYFPRPP
jgi:hypothetical protein